MWGQSLVCTHLSRSGRTPSSPGFAAVVCMVVDALLVSLRGAAGAFHCLSPRSPLALMEGPSPHPPARLQAVFGPHRSTDDPAFGAGSGHHSIPPGRALIT